MDITGLLQKATNKTLELPNREYDTRESENVKLQLEVLLKALAMRGIVPNAKGEERS